MDKQSTDRRILANQVRANQKQKRNLIVRVFERFERILADLTDTKD